MTRLQQGSVVDGFVVGPRVHSGAMAELYRVHYDGGRPDPGFPMVMKVPRMGGGEGAENLVGFEVEQPPEDWLVKVYDEDRMVDLIYRPVESPVTDETLHDTERISVEAIYMPVISATRLMVHKLLSYSQHHCDFATGLPVARSLREQIDWPRVRRETASSPYAEAFLILLDRLDVVPFPKEE